MIVIVTSKSAMHTCSLCGTTGVPLAQLGDKYDFGECEAPPLVCKECLLEAVRKINDRLLETRKQSQ